MKNIDFGKRLLEVRTSRGLTQEDVADKCNVTTRTIQRIESGAVTPRISTVKIIAEALDIDLFENSSQNSELKHRTFLWYIKDLFNFKTNAMRKISILSSAILIIVFSCVGIINLNAQSNDSKSYQNEEAKDLPIKNNKSKKVGLKDYTIKPLENDYALISKGYKYGLIDEYKSIIVPVEYDHLEMSGGYIYTKKKNKIGLLYIDGSIIVPTEYDHFEMAGNYIYTFKNNKPGLINLEGKIIIPNEFDRFEIVQNYVFTMKNNKQGLMNLDGRIIIPCEYDILNFGQNTIGTSKNNRPGIIDFDGKVIIPNEYDIFEMLGNYHYLTKKGNKEGLINLEGRVILSCEYDKIEIEDGSILATKNGKTKIVDPN